MKVKISFEVEKKWNESSYASIFFIKFGLGVDAEFCYHKTHRGKQYVSSSG